MRTLSDASNHQLSQFCATMTSAKIGSMASFYELIGVELYKRHGLGHRNSPDRVKGIESIVKAMAKANVREGVALKLSEVSLQDMVSSRKETVYGLDTQEHIKRILEGEHQ